MTTAASSETKEKILDVAEEAIAINGYAGTTLRGIVSKAQVNLAAVHYHFGSKEALFRAILARIAEPIVSGQLALLADLTARSQQPSVEAIVRAYLAPSLESILRDSEVRPLRARFVSRCRTEPDPIASIGNELFRPSTEKYLDAMQRTLPDQSRSQLIWKFDLMVTSLIRVLGEAGQPEALLKGKTPEDIEAALEKLINFLVPGIENG